MSKDTKNKEKRTCIGFLRALYKSDPFISNERALSILLANFPISTANNRSIIVWKKQLGDEGLNIPTWYTKSKHKQDKIKQGV